MGEEALLSSPFGPFLSAVDAISAVHQREHDAVQQDLLLRLNHGFTSSGRGSRVGPEGYVSVSLSFFPFCLFQAQVFSVFFPGSRFLRFVSFGVWCYFLPPILGILAIVITYGYLYM